MWPALIFLHAETHAGLSRSVQPLHFVRSMSVASFPSPVSVFRGTARTPAVPITAAAPALDRRVTSFNRAAEQITGVRREEEIGRRCKGVLKADVCAKGCMLRATLHSGATCSRPLYMVTIFAICPA